MADYWVCDANSKLIFAITNENLEIYMKTGDDLGEVASLKLSLFLLLLIFWAIDLYEVHTMGHLDKHSNLGHLEFGV